MKMQKIDFLKHPYNFCPKWKLGRTYVRKSNLTPASAIGRFPSIMLSKEVKVLGFDRPAPLPHLGGLDLRTNF